VPVAAAEHVAGCAECGREVEWQHAGHHALAFALADEARRWSDAAGRPSILPPPGQARTTRFRLPSVAMAAAAAVLLLAVGVGAIVLGTGARPGTSSTGPAQVAPDVAMADAAHSYGRPADYRAADAGAVSSWADAHGGAMPAMPVAGATCVGARMGTVGGRGAVTYLYQGDGGAVEVSALPGDAPPGWPMSETQMMDGRAVGMVHHGNRGLVVVAGSESQLMRFISQIQ
jgi:hypothetical protein